MNSPEEANMYKILESAIMQRKRAMDALQEGVAISDPTLPDNPVVYVNDAFLQMTGYTRDEVIGRNCRFLQGKETDPKVVEKIKQSIADKQPISIEILNYKKDGTEFWNHITISPVHNNFGEVVNYAAIQRDVTDIHNLRTSDASKTRKIEAMEKAIELLKERVEEQEDAIASFIMLRSEEQ